MIQIIKEPAKHVFISFLGCFGWYYYYYYYYYLEDHNDIFENDEFQYLAEKGFVLLFIIPGE